jgi:hypothetical protein
MPSDFGGSILFPMMLGVGKPQAYSPVATDEKIEGAFTNTSYSNQRSRWLLYSLAVVLSWLVVGSIGFLLGNSKSRTVAYGIGIDETINVSSLSWTFEHNETFSQAPSALTNRAWEAIFPDGHGFMKHPELAPQLSVLAVYHQLHCLVGIFFLFASSYMNY